MQFPLVDPIPLPAPVWLLKSLGLLTLATHFLAVQLLIGGLFLVCLLTLRGWLRRTNPAGTVDLSAAQVIARRLPIVMTYVINLGIPPLLFAQVLYGRALYTSSVLIAVLWISVIFLLMAAYWLLYRIPDRLSENKPAWLHSLGALMLCMSIGQIYSLNMTLMLRPEVWQAMYAKTATGLQAAPHDPTMFPRWAFMMCAGLVVGGVGAQLLSHQPNIGGATRRLLHKLGATLTAALVLPVGLLALRVYQVQPAVVQQGLSTNALYLVAAGLFGLGAVVVLVSALLNALRPEPLLPLSIGGVVGGALTAAGTVLYRDGIRDLTLVSKGFNVWQRTEVSNWSVIVLFLLLLVIGLVAIGWLISVLLRATPLQEGVPS